MGHDIMGYNKDWKEIAYARYGMWNHNARLLYYVLNAEEFDCGVSGSGDALEFDEKHLQEALEKFQQLKDDEFHIYDAANPEEVLFHEKEKLRQFLENCLEVAKQEGKVKIYFG